MSLITYDGKFPNLCRGTITLVREDGLSIQIRRLLRSGGSTDWMEDSVSYGSWGFDWDNADVKGADALDAAERVQIEAWVHANVAKGCCGGCI